mgnify:FL=1
MYVLFIVFSKCDFDAPQLQINKVKESIKIIFFIINIFSNITNSQQMNLSVKEDGVSEM